MQSFIDVTESEREKFNKAVTHPLQTFEWGEFRMSTGIQVVRRTSKDFKIAYSMTIHKIPKLPYYIGYIPKSDAPNKELLEDIKNQGEKYKCVYVQIEPNILQDQRPKTKDQNLKESFHPLFTKYSFILDLTPSEEILLANMHPKTRYNIRVAQKHNAEIIEDNSEKGFEKFLKLYEETTTRQKFYAHTPSYHKKLWKTLRHPSNSLRASTQSKPSKNNLQYHLLHAIYQPEADSQKQAAKTLTSWVLFSFKDTLYYPYGASSREHREVMASNLIMWEAIRLGKQMGLKKFDMWGALSENPDPKDSWFGFHKFKQGYGAQLIEFMGSYDLVIKPTLYEIVKIADTARWTYLKLKKR